MSKEGNSETEFYPQKYRGKIIALGNVARVVDLNASDLDKKQLLGLNFAISLKNEQDVYYNKRVGTWFEENNGENVSMVIDLPFPEQPTNFVITLTSEDNPKNLISFNVRSY